MRPVDTRDGRSNGWKQVIDLWMGRATSRDGALQLLHLIDFICNWARDVFRFDILCCLAGGKENLRYATLTYASRYSTQEPPHESEMSGQVGPGPRTNTDQNSEADTAGFTETASLGNLVLDDAIMEDQPVPVRDDGIGSSGSTHPLLRWANPSPYQAAWTRHATIRHSNMSLFRYSHLALPEDSRALVQCLQQVSGSSPDSIRDMALHLMTSFLDRTGAMTTTLNHILQLKREWLKQSGDVKAGPDSPVRALFSFRTCVRTVDWQIVRELCCISCTQQAAQELGKIAGMGYERLRVLTWSSTDMHPFSSSDFDSLRSLTGIDSATAAINSTVLYLAIQARDGGCQWISQDASESIPKSFALLSPSVSGIGTLGSLVDADAVLREVLVKPLPKDLPGRLGPPLPANRGAILLCKGRHWPETTLQWCLMVLKELDFEDNRELAKSLARAKSKADCYTFAFAGSYNEAGTPTNVPIDPSGDGRFLGMWLEHLSSGN